VTHRRTIRYDTSTTIHLSLEDFHNAGLTPEETKEVIENITDPGMRDMGSMRHKLHCERTYFNGNWKFNCYISNPQSIRLLVEEIRRALELKLSAKLISEEDS